MTEVNGRTYDFSDVQLRVGGNAPLALEILAISYKSNREVGKMFANGPKKAYRTRGRIDPDGEMRIPLHQRTTLLAALAAASPTGAFGDATVEVTVVYGSDNQGTMTDTLTDVIVMDIDNAAEEGTDGLEVTIPIDIGDIDYDGYKFFNDPTG